MKLLNLKSKEYETRKQRKEALDNKTLKDGDFEELKEHTVFITAYKTQMQKAEREYETFLKVRERDRRIESDEVGQTNEVQLAMLLDHLSTQNNLRDRYIDRLTHSLSKAATARENIQAETLSIADDNPFFRLTMQKEKEHSEHLKELEDKKVKLSEEMDYIAMRIGQEKNLVDGMNYKIQVLNDDIKMRLRQIQTLSLMKNVIVSRGTRLENTYITMKNENLSHGNAFKKKKLKKEQQHMTEHTQNLQQLDEELKRDINKEFEIFIKNRMQMEELKVKNQHLVDQISHNNERTMVKTHHGTSPTSIAATHAAHNRAAK